MIENHFKYKHLNYGEMVVEYDSHEDENWPRIQQNPSIELPRQLKRNSVDLFPIAALVAPNANRTWGYLLRAQSLGNAIFESNENDGKSFPLCYVQDHVLVTGQRDKVNASYKTWLTAFYISILARKLDIEGILYLDSIDYSVFKSAESGPALTPFNFALADLLKAVFTSGSDLEGALEQALVTSDPDDYPDDDAFIYASHIEWPIPSILTAIFSEDEQDEYNEEMEKALLLHKEYYSAPERINDPEGAISIPLTAMAVIAKQLSNYDLTINNEYIPDWIVN